MNNLLLIVILFSMSSCGIMSGLFMGQLDRYITSKTASRLSLNSEQKDMLAKDVKEVLNDIKPEAKVISTALKELIVDDKKISKFLVVKKIKSLEVVYLDTYDKAFKRSLKYFNLLDRDQSYTFLSSLNKQNRKLKKKIVKNKLHDEVMERLELTMGELTPRQKFIIKKNRSFFKKAQQLRLARNQFIEMQLTEHFKLPAGTRTEKLNLLYKVNLDALREDIQSDEVKKALNALIDVIHNMNKDQQEFFNDKLTFLTKLIDQFVTTKY